MDNIVYIFLLTIGASFIQRTTGFGFGIFIMTALPFLMPTYGEATALSGLLAMTTSAVITIRMYRYVTLKRLLPILAVFISISAVSIFALTRIQDGILRSVLGITLILTSIYFTFSRNRIRLKTTLPYQIGAGAISGVMGGFFGMQGPPAVLYFISSEPDKDHYMAMTQAYFLVGNLMMTIFRAWNGFITPFVCRSYLLCVGGIVVGTLAGSWAFRYIPAKIFPYIVYGYIGLSGIIISATS